MLFGVPEKGLAPAPLKGSTPRALPHQLVPALQLSGMGIHVSVPLVEGSTRKNWAGVPTRIMNVDQAPSLPSKLPVGVTEKAWVSLVGMPRDSRKEKGESMVHALTMLTLLTNTFVFADGAF